MEQWQPTNGIEITLIDAMAQAQTLYMQWMKTMSEWMSIEGKEQLGAGGSLEYTYHSGFVLACDPGQAARGCRQARQANRGRILSSCDQIVI